MRITETCGNPHGESGFIVVNSQLQKSRAGRYYRDTGISRYFIFVIRIMIQFGHIAIFTSLFIVAISCWNLP